MACILIAIGDDRHQYDIVITHTVADALDTETNGIIQRSAGTRIVLLRAKVLNVCNRYLVTEQANIVALKRNNAYQLL